MGCFINSFLDKKKYVKIIIIINLILIYLLNMLNLKYIITAVLIADSMLLIDILFEDKKIKNFVMIYIFINIILIIMNCKQANNWGFQEGIVHGNIKGVEYYDSFKYYSYINELNNVSVFNYISEFITNFFMNPYKYNPFIFIFFLVSKIIGISVVNLLIFKLSVTILIIYFFYKLISEFNFTDKQSITGIAIFGFYPGFIITNINFLRDNLILLMIMMFLYNGKLYFKYKSKNRYKNITVMIVSLIVMSFLRFYVSAALIVALIFIYLLKNIRNKKKIILAIKLFMMIFILVGILAYFLGYGFFAIEYIKNTFDFSNIILSLVELCIRQVVGFRVVFKSMFSGLLNNLLVMTSPVYIFTIALILIKLLVKKRMKVEKRIWEYLIFTIVFASIIGILLILRDGIIVERIYIMWIWIYSIIIINLKFKVED